MQDRDYLEPHELHPRENGDGGDGALSKTPAPPPSSVLGSGIITDQVGETDTEAIYRIRNERARATRVVRVLRGDATHLAHQAFVNETLLLAQLRHPNIILLKGSGQHGNLPFGEYENSPGCTLGQLAGRHGPLPVNVALSIATQILAGISYFHRHTITVEGVQYEGILHRNLHPDSLQITDSGTVKITGFGLATPVDASYHTYIAENTEGLAFFAPELLKGGKAGRSSDLYTFGLLLYLMLAGKPAFAAQSRALLINTRLNNRFVPLERQRRRIPRELLKIVDRCLQFDPSLRASDAEELFCELSVLFEARVARPPSQLLADFLTPGDERTKRGKKRKGAPPVVALAVLGSVVALLVALAAGGWYFSPRVRTAVGDLGLFSAPVEESRATGVGEKEVLSVSPPQKTGSPSDPVPEAGKVTPRTTQAPARTVRPPQPRTPQPAPVTPTTAPGVETSVLRAMQSAARNREWDQVLQLYTKLPEAQQGRDGALLLRLRALMGKNDTYGLGVFFSMYVVEDGEYHLHRARYHYDTESYTAALAHLDRAEVTRVNHTSTADVMRSVLYYRARTLSALYEQYPGEIRRSGARAAWDAVLFAYRDSPSHPRSIEAGRARSLLDQSSGP